MTAKFGAYLARWLLWPTTTMSIEVRQWRVRGIAAKFAAVASSADTADVLEIRLKTLLAELADVLSGYPNGALLKKSARALAAHTDLILMQCDRAPPGTGPSRRQALQDHARSLAATFGAHVT